MTTNKAITNTQVSIVERAYVSKCRLARKARARSVEWTPHKLCREDYRRFAEVCCQDKVNPLQAIYAATEKAIATRRSHDLALNSILGYVDNVDTLQRVFEHKTDYSIRCSLVKLANIAEELEVIYGEHADITSAVTDGAYRKSVEDPVILYGSLLCPTGEERLRAAESYLLCPQVYQKKTILYLDDYLTSFVPFPCEEEVGV